MYLCLPIVMAVVNYLHNSIMSKVQNIEIILEANNTEYFILNNCRFIMDLG